MNLCCYITTRNTKHMCHIGMHPQKSSCLSKAIILSSAMGQTIIWRSGISWSLHLELFIPFQPVMVNVIFFWQISSIILNLTVFQQFRQHSLQLHWSTGTHSLKFMIHVPNWFPPVQKSISAKPVPWDCGVSFPCSAFLLVGRTLSDESAVFHDISPDKKRHYTEAFSSVCEYIHQHYAENLCVDTAASMTGFSKYHFLRLFKQFAGDTFYHYVNAQRIYHACLLLSDPEKI